ncbi:uncharacterized protein [Palaemon carinicauda]|uniref:uncharacterized protein n=1 Tax=Palaemon carinicauda TaxID=392227 RepID=UPI0035B5D154
MDPLKSYFNPLEHILEDSEVDNGLEHLFSLESLGIKKCEKEMVSFDKEQIDRFREGISFDNGFYHVELPWYTDKIDSVPSNHFVSLKVLDRTVEYLGKKGLIDKYQEVFDKQLEDGVIEEIKVNSSDYHKTNKYVMLSDVKQAFLMIKLKNEVDKNIFCFFWKRGNKLVSYRYKTMVFYYTSSPFILNFVMKHHAESYPDDKCKEILTNNFYVDNLLITGNNIDEMKNLYKQANDRMEQGALS